MLIATDKSLVQDYMQFSDRDDKVNNFRLYYQGRTTNLVWYDGMIIYLPQEYFEFKNLVNMDMKKKHKCSIYLYEFNLIKELQERSISFLIEDNLAELIKRIKMCGTFILDNDVALEFISDIDYSKFYEPIYLGNGAWINIE